jgi:hypothetical protein
MTQRQVGFLVGLPFVLVDSLPPPPDFENGCQQNYSRTKIFMQNKTSQTQLSHGTFVEQPSPEVCS